MNRQQLADFLGEYAHGVVEEWMRLIDIEETQARVTWAGDGTFKVGELGDFRLTVNVEPIEHEPEPLEWVPGTWGETMQNDRVRLGGAEAVIEGFSKLDWHTTIERSFQKPDGKWWDLVRPFEHTSVHVRLAGRTDLLTFPPDSPVDILCTPTRRAMLTLTRGGLS